MRRRDFLETLPAVWAAPGSGPIDRRTLVRRHNPVLRDLDPRAPLSVGNGEFAFTADITGLQTFPERYDRAMPLCTQSQWGWHSAPGGGSFEQLRLQPFDTYGRQVGYPTSSEGQKDLFNWLRENPHRLHLGRIGLRLKGEISGATQELDLWTGTLRSRWSESLVEVCCHPELDMIAARVTSPAALGVVFEFPYGSPAMQAADWNQPRRHLSSIVAQSPGRVVIRRELDSDHYYVAIGWELGATFVQEGPHRFLLRGRPAFVCLFTKEAPRGMLPGVRDTFTASARHWERFWSTGGAVDFSASTDARAAELERRVVLSQYLTAIQCAGSLPPQESGLTCNSWYGKFHLEMHWWHAAHFALWGRLPLLERSLGWYRTILPRARETAKRQGYAGARWPKMTDPRGMESPSSVGPLLIWQQPHPIAYAELCRLGRPGRETLERYRDVVFETAAFMASFAVERDGRYVLGPPVIPAQENHPPRETWNPTYELEYWNWALGVAGRWRELLKMKPEPRWEAVRARLAALPVRDGLYLAHENCPQTFTQRNRDHPSMLAALGVLPGARVDPETMRRTLRKVLECWRWDDTWGWDYPMTAMTAARLNEPEIAIDALLMRTPKNVWLPNGHNYQRPNLPLYLPGNGGLLWAVALMAARGCFPKQGWKARQEGLHGPA